MNVDHFPDPSRMDVDNDFSHFEDSPPLPRLPPPGVHEYLHGSSTDDAFTLLDSLSASQLSNLLSYLSTPNDSGFVLSTIGVQSYCQRCWGHVARLLPRLSSFRRRTREGRLGSFLLTLVRTIPESHSLLEDEEDVVKSLYGDFDLNDNGGNDEDMISGRRTERFIIHDPGSQTHKRLRPISDTDSDTYHRPSKRRLIVSSPQHHLSSRRPVLRLSSLSFGPSSPSSTPTTTTTTADPSTDHLSFSFGILFRLYETVSCPHEMILASICSICDITLPFPASTSVPSDNDNDNETTNPFAVCSPVLRETFTVELSDRFCHPFRRRVIEGLCIGSGPWSGMYRAGLERFREFVIAFGMRQQSQGEEEDESDLVVRLKWLVCALEGVLEKGQDRMDVDIDVRSVVNENENENVTTLSLFSRVRRLLQYGDDRDLLYFRLLPLPDPLPSLITQLVRIQSSPKAKVNLVKSNPNLFARFRISFADLFVSDPLNDTLLNMSRISVASLRHVLRFNCSASQAESLFCWWVYLFRWRRLVVCDELNETERLLECVVSEAMKTGEGEGEGLLLEGKNLVPLVRMVQEFDGWRRSREGKDFGFFSHYPLMPISFQESLFYVMSLSISWSLIERTPVSCLFALQDMIFSFVTNQRFMEIESYSSYAEPLFSLIHSIMPHLFPRSAFALASRDPRMEQFVHRLCSCHAYFLSESGVEPGSQDLLNQRIAFVSSCFYPDAELFDEGVAFGGVTAKLAAAMKPCCNFIADPNPQVFDLPFCMSSILRHLADPDRSFPESLMTVAYRALGNVTQRQQMRLIDHAHHEHIGEHIQRILNALDAAVSSSASVQPSPSKLIETLLNYVVVFTFRPRSYAVLVTQSQIVPFFFRPPMFADTLHHSHHFSIIAILTSIVETAIQNQNFVPGLIREFQNAQFLPFFISRLRAPSPDPYNLLQHIFLLLSAFLRLSEEAQRVFLFSHPNDAEPLLITITNWMFHGSHFQHCITKKLFPPLFDVLDQIASSPILHRQSVGPPSHDVCRFVFRSIERSIRTSEYGIRKNFPVPPVMIARPCGMFRNLRICGVLSYAKANLPGMWIPVGVSIEALIVLVQEKSISGLGSALTNAVEEMRRTE